jgi:hypothetical protein
MPVRPERTFVWFAHFDTAERLTAHLAARAASGVWTDAIEPELSKRLSAPVEQHRLAPTARSALR